MNSVVYAIENLSDMKIYVGSSKEYPRRKESHLRALRSNKHVNGHLQNAWNKYGEDHFLFSVVEVVQEDRLREREQFWLNFFQPFGANGYNIRKDVNDGRRGHATPEEVKAKISATEIGRKLLPESIAKRSEKRRGKKFPTPWQVGVPKSDETKAKISISRKGKYFGENNKEAKLNVEKVLDIRERLQKGESGFSIAKLYGVTRRAVYMIRDGLSWTHL